jgi:hypothetical protein
LGCGYIATPDQVPVDTIETVVVELACRLANDPNPVRGIRHEWHDPWLSPWEWVIAIPDANRGVVVESECKPLGIRRGGRASEQTDIAPGGTRGGGDLSIKAEFIDRT